MRINIPPERIEAWVRANFKVHKTRKNGDELVIINPLTGHDKPRLNINLNGSLHDWGGDEWAGDRNPKTGKRPCHIIRFVQLYRNTSFREALRELVGDASLSHAYQSSGATETKEEATETFSIEIPSGFRPLNNPDSLAKRPLWNYLLSRGYTEHEILEQNLHFRGSDILWLYTEFGDLVYMQSRNIYNKQFWFPSTDVRNAKDEKIGELEVTRDHVLYGFDECPRAEYIILTESIFDQNTLGRHALSSGGVILTDGQLKRIKLIGPRQGVVLAPDNDKPAIESVMENGPRLANMGYKVFFSIPPQLPYIKNGEEVFTKDWNELYTGLKLTKPQIVATMNQRLVPFTEKSRLQLRQMVFRQGKAQKHVHRSSFLS